MRGRDLGWFTIAVWWRRKKEAVPLDQVPKAVLDAVKAKFVGAKLVSASKEDDDGKTIYKMELTHDGKQYDVSVTRPAKSSKSSGRSP